MKLFILFSIASALCANLALANLPYIGGPTDFKYECNIVLRDQSNRVAYTNVELTPQTLWVNISPDQWKFGKRQSGPFGKIIPSKEKPPISLEKNVLRMTFGPLSEERQNEYMAYIFVSRTVGIINGETVEVGAQTDIPFNSFAPFSFTAQSMSYKSDGSFQFKALDMTASCKRTK